jgi:hypothetical protein
MTPSPLTSDKLVEYDLNFDAVEEVQDNVESTPEETIGLYSPNWTNWVLSQLRSDEIFNGSPTVDGLRRITEEFIGIIVRSTSVVDQVPCPENQHRATVTHTVEIIPHTASVLDANGETVRLVFSGSADVYLNNTEFPYNSYPVGTADTRAEARALRRLLRLRAIAAEEVSQLVTPEDSSGEEKINPQQINFVNILAERVNVNVEKVAKFLIERPLKTINELSQSEAQKLNQTLSEYQQDKTKIPENLIGYDNLWKQTFSIKQ